jgi:hypothetical protein
MPAAKKPKKKKAPKNCLRRNKVPLSQSRLQRHVQLSLGATLTGKSRACAPCLRRGDGAAHAEDCCCGVVSSLVFAHSAYCCASCRKPSTTFHHVTLSSSTILLCSSCAL